MPAKLIISCTGHRPQRLGGFSSSAHQRLIGVAHQWLRHNVPKPHGTRVLSGMALGWDLAVAEAAQQLRIPLIAVIPFEGQQLAWPCESQLLWHRIRDRADDEWLLWGQRPTDATQVRQLLLQRNERLMVEANLVLAMFDGKPSGGTAQAVGTAVRLGKPIVNLYPQWQRQVERDAWAAQVASAATDQ